MFQQHLKRTVTVFSPDDPYPGTVSSDLFPVGDLSAVNIKNLLGGKGANLCEMNLIGVPVPPGFAITTEVCAEYNKFGQEKVTFKLYI